MVCTLLRARYVGMAVNSAQVLLMAIVFAARRSDYQSRIQSALTATVLAATLAWSVLRET
jgi:hypothetical protein